MSTPLEAALPEARDSGDIQLLRQDCEIGSLSITDVITPNQLSHTQRSEMVLPYSACKLLIRISSRFGIQCSGNRCLWNRNSFCARHRPSSEILSLRSELRSR